MKVRWKQAILTFGISLGLLATPAWADKDKDKDKQKDKGHSANDSGRPPGWDKGKKTGWGNCDVPPGQAKKQGCNGASSHNDRHDRDRHGDYDRDRDHDRTDVRHDQDRDRDRARKTTQPSALPNPKIVVKSPTAPATTTTTTTRPARPTRDAKTTAKTGSGKATDSNVRPNRN